MNEYQVKITYKSGASFIGWFTKFEAKMENNVLTSIDASHSDGQRLAYVGLDNIESIVRLSSRELQQ